MVLRCQRTVRCEARLQANQMSLVNRTRRHSPPHQPGRVIYAPDGACNYTLLRVLYVSQQPHVPLECLATWIPKKITGLRLQHQQPRAPQASRRRLPRSTLFRIPATRPQCPLIPHEPSFRRPLRPYDNVPVPRIRPSRDLWCWAPASSLPRRQDAILKLPSRPPGSSSNGRAGHTRQKG
jgi:hypothetical protein